VKKETHAMRRSDIEHAGQRGQVLVIFALAIIVLVGVVGLVLDGGGAFAQRRDEQSVADLAAMAAGTAFLNMNSTIEARTAAGEAAAQYVSSLNDYPNGVNGTVLSVTTNNMANGSTIRVDLTGDHHTNFTSLFGINVWDVSVTATVIVSDRPNGAYGVMPIMFNEDAFPGALCDEAAGGCTPEIYQLPGSGNEDVPQDATQFNWTVFCAGDTGGTTCEASSDDVADILSGGGNDDIVYLTDDISPLNAGTHTTLLDSSGNSGAPSLADHIGEAWPVPIVNDDGEMVGFGYFRLVSVEGAPDKVIRGYFISPVNAAEFVVGPGGGNSTLNTGAYLLKLVD
jgi:Putative Flp pilus-assembly TadE/G-like